LDGSTVNASLISGLGEPYGIAVSGNDLFVVNGESGTIGEYTTSAATVNADLISGLNSPAGLAISGNDLFVESFYGHTVDEYTLSGTAVNPSLISGLDSPISIVIVPEPSAVTLASLRAAALCLRRRA
jgi:hypothetical protein